MVGLEEQPRTARIGDGLPVDDDPHVTLARHHIDPFVRIARVDEDFFVFFIPSIHLVPLKGEMIFELAGLEQRINITPGGIISRFVSRLERPIRGLALVKTFRFFTAGNH